MDSDKVQGRMPTLPTELLAVMRPIYGNVPMKDTGDPMNLSYERSPAELIPPFD